MLGVKHALKLFCDLRDAAFRACLQVCRRFVPIPGVQSQEKRAAPCKGERLGSAILPIFFLCVARVYVEGSCV